MMTPEITKTEPAAVPTYMWVLLAVLIVFVYIFGLNLPLLGPDEPRYAQVAHEMFERGDWVTPTLGGFHWFEKPALLYWLQITFYHFFGVTEFAARFGSALFGLGTIAALWVLGRNMGPEKIERSNATENNVISVSSVANFPNYLALIAATSLGILVFARGASFDIIVTFPITAAMVSFFIFDQTAENRWRKKHLPLGLFYFFIGVSLIAKGLIGILFPFAIVAFYHLLEWRLPSRTLLVSLLWGTVLATAVAAIWYLPMYQRNGWEFIDEFIIQHHFQRYSSNKYQHPQPFIFFFWVLPLMTFPWVPFFFRGFWSSVRAVINRRADQIQPTASLLRFSFAWLLVPVVFFSMSGSKLPGYILPAVPAAIILTAFFAFGLVQKSVKWQRTVVTAAMITLISIVALLIFVVPKFADADSVRPLIADANARGFSEQRVFMVYTLSHNAEFYAPGRLLRDDNGKQRTFYHVDDLLPYLARENGSAALALVPIEHLAVLTKDARIEAQVLNDNTELAIVELTIK